MASASPLGILGDFYDPDAALAAATKVRDAGWTHFDVLTPFPVHGMDRAMGLGRSWLPWATLALAFGGIAFAQGLQNYVMVFDWPMNFGGKPFASWPAFVPITFEAMVFWAAIGTAILAILAGKRTGPLRPPPSMLSTGATTDRFVLWIASSDPQWNDEQAKQFVASLGADHVRLVDEKGSADA